ncbi:MAG: type VII toxin-antitoxin system MntA family adenylyltransferase antitoxin [Candidatus Hodarchaeales archaeon]
MHKSREVFFEEISRVLDDFPSIKLGYLFGPALSGLASRQKSDIDIAVLFDHSTPSLQLILELNDKLTAALEKKIDLVILNDSSIRTRFEVIKEGQIVICKDNEARIDFEQQAMARYYDRRYYDLRATKQQLQDWSKNGLL